MLERFFLARIMNWKVVQALVGKIGGWQGELYVSYLAIKHYRTPLLSKLIAGIVMIYALSPIDFASDFIPVLGLVDDAILVSLGIVLTHKLVPPDVLAECRHQAELKPLGKQLKAWTIALLIVLLIITLLMLGIVFGVSQLILVAFT